MTYLVDDQTPSGYAQISEESISGSVVARYTYGLMRISQLRDGVLRYYSYDGGGSVRALVNSAAAVTDTYSYDAFGTAVALTGSTSNSFRYRGEWFDSTLRMYYLRARYYVPHLGRFLTADRYEAIEPPVCPCQSATVTPAPPHVFLYAGADPVNRIDPSGLSFIKTGVYIPVATGALPELASLASGTAVAAANAIRGYLAAVQAAPTIAAAVPPFIQAVRLAVGTRQIARILICGTLSIGATYLYAKTRHGQRNDEENALLGLAALVLNQTCRDIVFAPPPAR